MRRSYDRPDVEPGERVPFFTYCKIKGELDVRFLEVVENDNQRVIFREDNGELVSLAGLHQDAWGAFSPKTIRAKCLAHSMRQVEERQRDLAAAEKHYADLEREFNLLEMRDW